MLKAVSVLKRAPGHLLASEQVLGRGWSMGLAVTRADTTDSSSLSWTAAELHLPVVAGGGRDFEKLGLG